MHNADQHDAALHHRALRFLTAGSVDDGKSTLIGRLLLDSRAILADQLDALSRDDDTIALADLTDGLEAEREQGITIDVAYRYFATPKRKFIIADAPGHEQYTRNMVTAAAGSDCALILVDVTKFDFQDLKLLPQTRRHTLLARLLRVPSIVFVVNKLDAVAQPEAAFVQVERVLRDFAAEAGVDVAAIVPVSALHGDNVVGRSAAWSWYQGPALLPLLEGLPAAGERVDGAFRLPVQFVQTESGGVGHQARALWGRIAQGRVQSGAQVSVFPSGQSATVVEVRGAGGVALDGADAGASVGLVLDRQLDVSRGDWILAEAAAGRQQFQATLAWLDTEPAVVGRKYWLRHGARWVQGRIAAIEHRLDIHTLQPLAAEQLAVNDIGQVRIETQAELPLADYADNRDAGALIVVDPASNRTSGALLVEQG